MKPPVVKLVRSPVEDNNPVKLDALLESASAAPEISGGSEILVEHVLAVIMRSNATQARLEDQLKQTVGHVRVTALIRVLLFADDLICKTFANSDTGQADAELARRQALIFIAALDELEIANPARKTFLLDDLTS